MTASPKEIKSKQDSSGDSVKEIVFEEDRPATIKDFTSCVPTITILIITGILCLTLIPHVFRSAWNAMIKDSKIYELREEYEIPEDEELPPEILAELKNLNYL